VKTLSIIFVFDLVELRWLKKRKMPRFLGWTASAKDEFNAIQW